MRRATTSQGGIEQSRLFARTVYIADRHKELKPIAKKLRELYQQILGLELKTNNPRVIDETSAQVDDLITPFAPTPFDSFDKRFRAV